MKNKKIKSKKSEVVCFAEQFGSLKEMSKTLCDILDSESICKRCANLNNPSACIGLSSCADALADMLGSEVQ